jgi:hypothetical protein
LAAFGGRLGSVTSPVDARTAGEDGIVNMTLGTSCESVEAASEEPALNEVVVLERRCGAVVSAAWEVAGGGSALRVPATTTSIANAIQRAAE